MHFCDREAKIKKIIITHGNKKTHFLVTMKTITKRSLRYFLTYLRITEMDQNGCPTFVLPTRKHSNYIVFLVNFVVFQYLRKLSLLWNSPNTFFCMFSLLTTDQLPSRSFEAALIFDISIVSKPPNVNEK